MNSMLKNYLLLINWLIRAKFIDVEKGYYKAYWDTDS